MKKLFALFGALLLVGCHVQSVDSAQSIAIADKFYGALKHGDGATALAQFSPAFKTQESNWPRLLGNLQNKYGPVSSAAMQSASLTSNGEDPCYLLTYSVQRGSLSSRETLFICSKANTSPWLISGQSMTRLDTNQSIAGGMLPSEIGVHVP
jgi:S-formylglutathione hydrolase FrmB